MTFKDAVLHASWHVGKFVAGRLNSNGEPLFMKICKDTGGVIIVHDKTLTFSVENACYYRVLKADIEGDWYFV